MPEAILTNPPTGADFAATDGAYLAEIDGRLLTILRASDDKMITFYAGNAPQDFKACCKSHGAAEAIATYLRIAPYQASDGGRWLAGSYKPRKVAKIIADMLESVA